MAATHSRALTLTLLVSGVIHAFVLLAVGFTWDPPAAAQPQPVLDIALVSEPQDEAPEDYDFAAAANQQGGGAKREAKPQRTPMPSTPVAPASGVPEAKPTDRAQRQQQKRRERQVSSRDTESQPEPAAQETEASKPSASDILKTSQSVAAAGNFAASPERAESRFPDKKRITARTREHAAAAYMRAWIDKVERVGNMNYPSEARRRGLAGRLILEVTLAPDGSVRETEMLQNSPHPVLDQAALRIVDLAAPFAPVPEQVLQGNDLLVITRTWEFSRGRDFRAE